jgi:tetratricopeptide (TPR) repeat protein
MESESLPGSRGRILAGAAQSIVQQLFRDAERGAEHMGEAFLVCERMARERPIEFEDALRSERLHDFFLPAVRASIRPERSQGPNGGWLGTFLSPDGRAIEDAESSGVNGHALQQSERALKRAISIAEAEGNGTMLRNLRWHRARLDHRSYDAIAREEGRPAATIRTGVARARKFLLQVVHELRQAQPAPLSGDAPPEIEPLRKLWESQEVAALRRELERTSEEFAEDPHWLNLAGLVTADEGRHDDAEELLLKALVFADAPSVRARVLNNLGNLAEEGGRPDDARQFWLRASQLAPTAPAPLLNLLALASLQRDFASAQHFIAMLSDLLNSGKLSAGEDDYLHRRLEENPKFDWLRTTDAWSAGPARWIRARSARRRRRGRGVVAALGLMLALVTAGILYLARDASGPGDASGATPAAWSGEGATSGQALLARGDSMGRKPGGGGRGRGRRHAA